MVLLDRNTLYLDAREVETDSGRIKNLRVTIGGIQGLSPQKPAGPTPFPGPATLRAWDRKLLSRYRPFYMPLCELCCLCTFGKCDLSQGRRGACGITMEAQQSRVVLLACCIGAATHTAHARELVDHIAHRFGERYPLGSGCADIEITAPITRLVCGYTPKTVGDLDRALGYAESQITQLLAATHTGQEGNYLDFESKVFHAGMIDHLGMEIADLTQAAAFDYPVADPDTPLAELGMSSVDTSKPVILVIGHNVVPSVGIVDYARDHNLSDEIEVTGICCTALDLTRYSPGAKVIGPISWQLRFIRSGIPDLVVVDEQCVRTDLVGECQSVSVPVIATSGKNSLGLPDRTADKPGTITRDLVNGSVPGVFITDPGLVGEVAVETARALKIKKQPRPSFPSAETVQAEASLCTRCTFCRRACPGDLPLVQALVSASSGDTRALASLYDFCIGCARCETACPRGMPLHSFILSASKERIQAEKFMVRTGRGAISDVEIRRVGGPIVLGEIPGIVAFVGCSNYPRGGSELAAMCREFAKRRFIVCTSGCSAITAGLYKNEEGLSIYEEFPGNFEAGGVLNVGSCVSNAHIAGAAIKIAAIFAKRELDGNYEEIADYVYNRVGAVGVAWGAMSQKAAAIASGFWRLGIPVIVGPHGTRYRRMLLGRADHQEDWEVFDARTGDTVNVGPVPEHLFISAETWEEAMVLVAKLSMRPNDTPRGRSIKCTHYVDLHKRFYGTLPDDLHRFIRTTADIPLTFRDEILVHLRNHGWKERPVPDPTTLERMVRRRGGGDIGARR